MIGWRSTLSKNGSVMAERAAWATPAASARNGLSFCSNRLRRGALFRAVRVVEVAIDCLGSLVGGLILCESGHHQLKLRIIFRLAVECKVAGQAAIHLLVIQRGCASFASG